MNYINAKGLIRIKEKKFDLEKQKEEIENAYIEDEEFLDRALERIHKALEKLKEQKKERIKKLEDKFNSKTNIEEIIECNPITNEDLITYLNETRGGDWAFFAGEIAIRIYYLDHSYKRRTGYLAGLYNKAEWGENIEEVVFKCEKGKAEQIDKDLKQGGINENYIGILPLMRKLTSEDISMIGRMSNILDESEDVKVKLPDNCKMYLGISSYKELYRQLGDQNWTYFFLNYWKQIDYYKYCFCDFKPMRGLNFDTGIKELVNEYINSVLHKQTRGTKQQSEEGTPDCIITSDGFEIPY